MLAAQNHVKRVKAEIVYIQLKQIEIEFPENGTVDIAGLVF